MSFTSSANVGVANRARKIAGRIFMAPIHARLSPPWLSLIAGTMDIDIRSGRFRLAGLLRPSGSWRERVSWPSSPTHGPWRGSKRTIPMDSEELKATQAPLKAKYRDEPKAAVITLKA